MQVEPWVWAVFGGSIAGLLALDLFVFHRNAHAVSFKEAATWSAIWIGLGLAFGALLWWWRGGPVAGEYLAGYLIEKSLSVDNLFVFALIFSAFAVPAAYQHRVLFWGVVGAIVLRAVFIALGAVLLEQFHWMIFVFGGLLIFTGIRMALNSHREMHPEHNPLVRLLARLIPMTRDFQGPRFFVRHGGKLMATPLVAVLVTVEVSDVIFAVDSIPAIFAVTSDPFLVFTSNAFAILGLRSLYFMLAGMMDRFVYLKYGLAAVLVFVGVKLAGSDWFSIPIQFSLLAILLMVGTAVAASLIATRGRPAVTASDGTVVAPVEVRH